MTAFQNGVLIQDNVALWGPTEWLQAGAYVVDSGRGPIALQDHGNPVRYRNIWVRELPEGPPPIAPPPPAAVGAGIVLDAVVGRYQDGDGMVLVINRAGAGLEVVLPGGRRQPLIPLTPTEFAFGSTAATLTVDAGPADRPQDQVRMGATVFGRRP
jgi:hypothetical protein